MDAATGIWLTLAGMTFMGAFLGLLWIVQKRMGITPPYLRDDPVRAPVPIPLIWQPDVTRAGAADQPGRRGRPFMSRHHAAMLRRRAQRDGQPSVTHLLDENAKLKLENQRLKTQHEQLRHISDGQRKGVYDVLKRRRAGKPVTDTNITQLLGKDKTLGLRVVQDEEQRITREILDATPVPPDIAQMEPLPH